MRSRIILLLIIIVFHSCNNKKQKYLGGDYRLFKDSNVWGLALPMKNNNFDQNWGAAAYGILLKDIDDSVIEKNIFHKNERKKY